jgi:hypothetical protein
MGSVNDERSPMNKRFAARRTLILCAVAAAVVVGAGAAVAAGKDVFDPEQEREAFQAAVAEKLGVTTAELENAYKAAALEQLDAAVADGRLTKEHADAIRERIEAGDFLGPHFGFGFGPKHHLEGGPGLEGAADYLGLTEAELHERLRNGQTLAEIAEAEGKSVSGLEQALLTAAKARLDEAVADGRITAAQRDELLERVEAKIDALVNGEAPLLERGPGFGHRFGGPMDGSFVPLAPPDA